MSITRVQFEEAIKTYGVRGLASKLGITPAYVSMIANGKRELTPAVLTRFDECVNKQMASLGRLEHPPHCLEARWIDFTFVSFDYRLKLKAEV